MISLGISVGHDMGAVLIKDGKIIVGISEERITRIKSYGAYQHRLPESSMRYCIEAAGIEFKDIDRFIYSTTELPDDYSVEFEKITGLDHSRLEFIPHHLAHAFSTFYSSGFEDSAVLVVDASGSEVAPGSKANVWFPEKNPNDLPPNLRLAEAVTIYHFQNGSYKEPYKKWIKMSDEGYKGGGVSVGIMYGTGAMQLVYDPANHSWQAGKLMGLASYADKEFVNRYPDFVEFLDNDVFIPFGEVPSDGVNYLSDFQSKANVAGVYQREQEKLLLYFVSMANRIVDSKNLCVAGGSFLNCNSNELIEEYEGFKNKYYLPSSDDSGIPLGCAWYGQNSDGSLKKGEYLKPYLGKKYTNVDVTKAFFESNLPDIEFKEYLSWDELLDYVSESLIANKVIGWFQDGSETGPRALGNRSILGNPASKWVERYINSEIKNREWYRPFAPSVLEEHRKEIFELDCFSPYMLITTEVKEEWREKIPGVTHIDNTSRYQSVTAEMNPKYHSLISRFYEKTGIPLLLNTSFNGRGEPIVESPADAIQSFYHNNLHMVVINNIIVQRRRD
jgi:carbamoyltransferase